MKENMYGILFDDIKKVTSEEADGLLAFLDELLGIVNELPLLRHVLIYLCFNG